MSGQYYADFFRHTFIKGYIRNLKHQEKDKELCCASGLKDFLEEEKGEKPDPKPGTSARV